MATKRAPTESTRQWIEPRPRGSRRIRVGRRHDRTTSVLQPKEVRVVVMVGERVPPVHEERDRGDHDDGADVAAHSA
eukprot:4319872-Prymnesium_polylepis.1